MLCSFLPAIQPSIRSGLKSCGEKENKSRVQASVKKNSPKHSVKEEEVARRGQRIEKIENIIKIIDENLSNPLIYEQYNDDKLRKLQKQRKEAIEALKKAEMLWEKAINLM